MTRHTLSLSIWLLACAPAEAPTTAPDPCTDCLYGEVELDPALLAAEMDKADGDPCAAYPGGPLRADSLLVLLNRDEGQQLAEDAQPPDLVPIDPALMVAGRQGLARAHVRAAYRALADAALAEEGFDFKVRSAYRSYQTQCFTFDYWVRVKGLAHASRYSAQPGRSQHQLGTTLDVTCEAWSWDLVPEVGQTPEAAWLFENAWRFGFTLSYPEGAESITGYGYEPWHFRYIGVEAAAEMHEAELIQEGYLRACQAQDPTLSCPEELIAPLTPNFEFIGAPCGSDADCVGAGEGAVCLTDRPGGMCSKPCTRLCPDQEGASGTFCVADAVEVDATPATTGLCHGRCDHDLYGESGCREGYACVVGQRPSEGGAGAVCLPL